MNEEMPDITAINIVDLADEHIMLSIDEYGDVGLIEVTQRLMGYGIVTQAQIAAQQTVYLARIADALEQIAGR